MDAVQNTQSRHHHLARLFAMPAFGEPLTALESKSLFFQAAAAQLLRNHLPEQKSQKEIQCQVLCVGEVVKRVMSPNVIR